MRLWIMTKEKWALIFFLLIPLYNLVAIYLHGGVHTFLKISTMFLYLRFFWNCFWLQFVEHYILLIIWSNQIVKNTVVEVEVEVEIDTRFVHFHFWILYSANETLCVCNFASGSICQRIINMLNMWKSVSLLLFIITLAKSPDHNQLIFLINTFNVPHRGSLLVDVDLNN